MACDLYEHIPYTYLRVELAEIDAMKVQHARVYGICRKCQSKYLIGKIHVPKLPA